MNYPPPWQDIGTLVAHISVSPHTIENWIARYGFPAARMRGGKRGACLRGPLEFYGLNGQVMFQLAADEYYPPGCLAIS